MHDRFTYKNTLIFILFASVFVHILLSVFNIVSTKAPDFEVLWLGARDLIIGNNPYLNREVFTGIGYPLTTLMFYIPFSLVDFKLAQTFFVPLSFMAILLSVFLSLKIVTPKIKWQDFLFFSALALLSFPAKFTLGMGQNNAISLLLLLLSVYFYKKEKFSVSGIFLGLSFSLKTIFLFFLILPVLKRKWRVLLTAMGVFTLFFVTSSLLGDLNFYETYLKGVISPLMSLEGREIYFNQGISGFVSRIFEDLYIRNLATAILSVLFLANSAYLILKSNKVVLSFSLLTITLLLIDSLSWQHHFVWLIFPFIVLTLELIRRGKLVLIGLLIVSYLLISWNFKNPALFETFPKDLLLSHTFYGTLILYFINSRLFSLQ